MERKMYLTQSKKLVGLLTLSIMASSCSLLPTKQIEVTAKPMDRIITQPVMPREIDLKEPMWYVVSEKNIDEFHDRLTKEHGQIVFVAMSIPDYELMSYNMQELKRYITELKEVVVYYESNMENPNADEEIKIANANVLTRLDQFARVLMLNPHTTSPHPRPNLKFAD